MSMRVIGMLRQKSQEHSFRLIWCPLDRIDLSQVEICLVEFRRNPDALFESLYCPISLVGAQIEDA